MKHTRQHIADKALILFNQQGFVNVRLQHIADAAFVSIGHLAYHFKNKDSLVAFLFEQMLSDKLHLLSQHKDLALFLHLDQLFEKVHAHQQKYRFLYVDVVEIARAYPDLSNKWAALCERVQLQLKLMLQYYHSRGVLDFGRWGNNVLAISFQNYMDHWLHNHSFENEGTEQFKKACWMFLSAYFTQGGWAEFDEL